MFVQGRVGKRFALQTIVDIYFIVFTTNIFFNLSKNKTFTYIYNSVFCFILNIQLLIKYCANTFLSLAMITNMDSIKALSGHGFLYFFLVLIFIVFSFLPIFYWKNTDKQILTFIVLFIFLIVGTLKYKSFDSSPYISLLNLPIEYVKHCRLTAIKKINKKNSRFYKKCINNYITKDSVIIKKPNIILIFTEGLSENIIFDDRNIMPNVAKLSKHSIRFEKYYNHTFATYRGIIGQLYSGYQQENYDKNQLVSLQSILKKNGYHTCFINTEPNNKDFSLYLNNMGFDTVIENKGKTNGIGNSLSDADAYELLYNECLKRDKKDSPFFMGIYTFGTHASFDGIDSKFDDGKSHLLNKFYDLDKQFGSFFEKFLNSDLLDDTILIFTTDHATYNDLDFTSAFPDYKRLAPDCDKIPLYIFYNNCRTQYIDVGGGNFLNLVPTILDFLDISDTNYFIGDSLFNPDKNELSNQFHCLSSYYKTDSEGIHKLNKQETYDFETLLAEYFIIKKTGSEESNKFEACYASAYETDSLSGINLNLYNAKGTKFKIACWSDANNQADLRWFDFSVDIEEEKNTFFIPLGDFSYEGVYDIHIYSEIDGNDVFQTWTTCIVKF